MNAPPPDPRVLVQEERTVTAASVRIGDEVNVRGVEYTVRDMNALPGARKRLHFDGGATYVLARSATLRARRWVRPGSGGEG